MGQKRLEVIMGISGSGKSTCGIQLAKRTSLPFLEGDDFHPNENVLKMSRGLPLDDEDRWPWLAAIVEYVSQHHRDHFVLSCSALKASYRDFLSQKLSCQFYLLEISKAEAIHRLEQRKGHFMPSTLVDSQFSTLELTPDIHRIAGEQSTDQIVEQIHLHME